VSARNEGAPIVDLTAARQRPVGQRTVERLSDGRRKGNHGNRAPKLMKEAVLRHLNEILDLHGDVTPAHKRAAAKMANVDPHTVNRWWRTELATHLTIATETGTAQVDENGDLNPDTLPRYLYKYAEHDRLQFRPDEIAIIGQHTYIKDGFAELLQRPNTRLKNYGKTALYEAYANVSEPVRIGAKKGDKVQRQNEATYPLTGRDHVNQTWSIDEYDLKVAADYHGITVHPKALIVRERRSGTPLAYLVVPRAADGIHTGQVLAAAAVGFTCTHPNDPNRQLRVAGVARMLVSDQGANFLGHANGDGGAAAARRLGIGLNPTASHRPQANGDHEVMHQSLLRFFADGAGTRRGWTNRAGNPLDHGVLPWATVLEDMEEWWVTYLNTAYTSGDRKGRTRLQVYADNVDAGNVYAGHELTPADEAALAVPVAACSYDETRGLVYDNRRWLSPELAAAAKAQETITLKQLLDPDTLYAFDRKERFIGIVRPRALAELDLVQGLHNDRYSREQFVEHQVGRAAAQKARDEAVAAAAEVSADTDAWEESAEGLANASTTDPEPEPELESVPDPEYDPGLDPLAEQFDPWPDHNDASLQTPGPHIEFPEVIKPTRRRRRPAPTPTNADTDAAAERAAERYSRLNQTNNDQPEEGDDDAR